MSMFIRRNLRQANFTVSTRLLDGDQLGNTIGLDTAMVLYCGSEDSPQFNIFQSLARDRAFHYYHSSDKELCSMSYIVCTGKYGQAQQIQEEKERFWDRKLKSLEDRLSNGEVAQEEYENEKEAMEEKKKLSLDAIGFSDKLWKEAQLERPVIYVMYKRNSLNEMVEFVGDVTELRKRLRLAGMSNFYTDFDKAYPENLETAKKWLAVFSERVNEEEGLCAEIKAISKKYKFVDEDQMFGCFNKSSEMAFHLIGRKEDYGSRLYYWSYENPVTKGFNGLENTI